jgi:D-3-phosphoglycerate dehydrogenase
MSKPHVLILAPFSKTYIEQLSASFDITYSSWLKSMKLRDPDEMASLINSHKSIAVLIESDFIFEETLTQVNTLKFIGICRSAINHVDIDSATEHNIAVVNTPARNARAVAEYVLSVTLNIARKTTAANNYVHSGMWKNPTDPYREFRGSELEGKKIGLLGMGAIGREIAALMYKLGMEILSHDPYLKIAPKNVRLTNVDELISKSDFLVTVAPLNQETIGFMNAKRLSQMKKGSALITVSGVSIVDQKELVKSLNSGHLSGAAIDVFDTHPVAPDSPLFGNNNLLLTPHIAGATHETIERHSNMLTTDLIRFLNNVKPVNIINPEVLNHI